MSGDKEYSANAVGLLDSNYETLTLVDLLRQRSIRQPDSQAYTFLLNGQTEAATLTYAELDRRARAICGQLRFMNMTGERALLIYSAGLEYVAAFFGCLYAGVVAAPVNSALHKRALPRLLSIANDARPRVALTTQAAMTDIESLLDLAPELRALRWLATDADALNQTDKWRGKSSGPDDIAYLQYTSGSTTAPRGVMVSHRNIMHNLGYIDHDFEHSTESTFISWLPHFHDMGLIYGILQPLFNGAGCLLMSPFSFIQKPIRWLQAISRYGVTHSAAPNFAYDLCVNKTTAEQRASLDLSSWRVAVNGAEPVREETLERFARAFEPCGFNRDAMCPAYGLAEASLKVCAKRVFYPTVVCSVRPDGLERNKVMDPGKEADGGRTLIGCGRPGFRMNVAIVHPETLTRCSPDEVGEVWVSGPSIAQGYWNQPDETDAIFHARICDTGEGPFLRTGDLGFLRDGELFITGRLKDMMIIGGRNHYPQDIETTVETSHPSLRQNCTAAFSTDIDGEERLIVLAELDSNSASSPQANGDKDMPAARAITQPARTDVGANKFIRYCRSPYVDSIITAIRKAVAEHHEIQAYDVLLLKSGSVPKTSSGKIQRHLCKKTYLSGGRPYSQERNQNSHCSGAGER